MSLEILISVSCSLWSLRLVCTWGPFHYLFAVSPFRPHVVSFSIFLDTHWISLLMKLKKEKEERLMDFAYFVSEVKHWRILYHNRRDVKTEELNVQLGEDEIQRAIAHKQFKDPIVYNIWKRSQDSYPLNRRRPLLYLPMSRS